MARPNVVVLIQTSEEMFLPANLTHKFMKFVNNMVNVYNLKVSFYIALSKLICEFVKVRIKIYYSQNSGLHIFNRLIVKAKNETSCVRLDNVESCYSLLAFVGICLIIINKWPPLSLRLL